MVGLREENSMENSTCKYQCSLELSSRLRWYRVNESSIHLEQAWICIDCGRIVWKEIPIEAAKNE